MITNKIVCFLFLLVVIISAKITQKEVDEFIRSKNEIPQTAIINYFTQDNEKGIITYKNENTKYKYIVGKNQFGKMFIIFKQQLTEINLFNSHGKISNRDINPIPFLGFRENVVQNPVMNMMIQPPMSIRPFNLNIMKNRLFPHRKGFYKNKMFRNERKQYKHECKINTQQITNILKQNLLIFKNMQIQKITKNGFKKGVGFILDIILKNDNKQYKIIVGYLPRYKKLSIIKIQQFNPIQDNKIDVVNNQPTINYMKNQVQPVNANFQNIVQSFVQKLMLRRNLQIPQQIKQQNNKQTPFLLGSQGQPQNPYPQINKDGKKTLIVGEENQPENPMVLEQIHQTDNNEKNEFPEEEMNNLVDDVLEKLKLKLE